MPEEPAQPQSLTPHGAERDSGAEGLIEHTEDDAGRKRHRRIVSSQRSPAPILGHAINDQRSLRTFRQSVEDTIEREEHPPPGRTFSQYRNQRFLPRYTCASAV